MFLGNRNITTVDKRRPCADPETFPEGGVRGKSLFAFTVTLLFNKCEFSGVGVPN